MVGDSGNRVNILFALRTGATIDLVRGLYTSDSNMALLRPDERRAGARFQVLHLRTREGVNYHEVLVSA